MSEATKAWRILVPTDGSESAQQAVAAAAELPWPDGSELRVISVVKPMSGVPETMTARRAQAEDAVALARARLEKTGRGVSSEVLSGLPSRVILAAASAWKADVVVVGSRGLGAVREALIGSVSSAVARAATCSVLVVKSDLGTPVRAVMAVDGSEDARTAARRLARVSAPGNAVTVVRAIESTRVRTLGLLPRRIGGAIKAELERATVEARSEAEKEARAVAEIFREAGWEAQAVVREGIPAVEVMTVTRATNASLVGVGPRGVTGIERILLGSVTERLLSVSGLSLFIGR